MKRSWMLAVASVVGVGALTGGVAQASNYPPNETTVTTVVVASAIRAPEAPAVAPDPALAATGSDVDGAVKLAAGALAAGLGLVLVARTRRRPADA